MDRGDEPVGHPEEVRQLRAQARRIYVESAVLATLLTGFGLLLAAWAAG
jgi:hypothetical protein